MADNITILAQARANWVGTLSDDDKAKVATHREETKANPEESKQEFMATFGTADTNGNGVLEEAEFNNCMEMLGSNIAAKGVPHKMFSTYSDEGKAAAWAHFNGQTPDTPGVSPADFNTGIT